MAEVEIYYTERGDVFLTWEGVQFSLGYYTCWQFQYSLIQE